MGGLDLTGGRYDTPDFELFSTLLDEHNGDFRNSNAKSVPPEQVHAFFFKNLTNLFERRVPNMSSLTCPLH